MHRALAVPEIVGLIFDHLEGVYLALNRRQDFAALARTCKSFHDPALDVLWKRQNTLTYILKCLPSDVWEETHDADLPQLPAVRFIKTPKPADWNRPLNYTHRIRALTLIPASDGRTHDFPTSDVLATIERCFPRGNFFPNLQDLFWSQGSTDTFHYIRLFVGPKISRASLRIPANTADMSPLSLLRYSELQSLTLKFSSGGTSPRTSSNLVLELAQIQFLSIGGLDRAAVDHLSRLPHLKSLDLSKTDVQDLVQLPDSFSQYHPFPALRSLTLDDLTVEFSTALINMMCDCRLKDFCLFTDILSLQTTMGHLYTALAGHLSHTTLHSIWMSELRDELTPPPVGTIASYVITGRILSPLFAFKNLTSIYLTGPVGFDIDDTAAWDMARAWPKIKSLTLNSSTALHHPSSMTLHGLRAFATHCTELCRLAITVDASTVPPFDSSPAARISQHELQTFYVQASPIGDPPTVAKYLSGLFLGLASICTPNEARWSVPAEADEDEETAAARARHVQWKYVEILVPFIASVREEERQWVDGE
ncbi:hypothetical protein DFH06DRAFT_1469958 [Mycena polygramma]|nr:hypothetical protein DFH06DRAFT_1469958 [Mycena polygramma]